MSQTLQKIPTGHPGLDHILVGGLPHGRSTLVSGTAGSGKTVFALQFLIAGTARGEAGVFVTFEEKPQAIRENARSLGFDVESLETAGSWAFIDASFDPADEEVVIGAFDFSALIARIEHAVRMTGATRVAVDSMGAVFSRYTEPATVRRELLRVAYALRALGVTSVLTSERSDDFGEIGRFGVEEFVCDNVMVLRNVLAEETRRRTIEVLKMRGVDHLSGEFPFTILPDEGIVVITLEGTELDADSSSDRIASGLAELDRMAGGGFLRDSITLVAGATGVGKTLLVTEFADGGARQGERSLILSFEESRSQLFRNAAGWGRDFEAHRHEGLLKVVSVYPEVRSLEDHLVRIKREIEEYRPSRVAIDSLSALERIAPARSFREFLIGLTSFLKHRQIAAMLTATARNLLGGESVTEAHVSTLTDMIILLRYVEVGGEIRRGFTVLKLRGSTHDKRIHEFTINGTGMHIGRPFRDVTGILAGTPRESSAVREEINNMAGLFEPGTG